MDSVKVKDRSNLKVSLIQYTLKGNIKIDELILKVRLYVINSKEENCELVVLPELFILDLIDFEIDEKLQFDNMIENILPYLIDKIQLISIEYDIYILAGSIPIKTLDNKIRNRSYLLSPISEPIYQEKIFLTVDEINWGWEGATELKIFELPWGITAILICYDSEIPILSNILSQYQIDLLLVPSMTSKYGFTRVRWACQGRAIEHLAYVLVTGVSCIATKDWELTAQAAALGPSLPGFIPLISEGNIDSEEIVYANLDFEKLLKAKKDGNFYPVYDQQQKMSNITLNHVFRSIKKF